MYIFIGTLALLFLAITVVQVLSHRNWQLIYTAFGSEEYFRIMGKLKREGVKLKISTPYRGLDSRSNRFKDHTQYDIYVRKGDEAIAAQALHKRN